MDLYSQFKGSGKEFISQCLGKCQDFSIDIVNVPRIAIDDLPRNECNDFTDKITHHFLELDKSGNIVRIV
ncbi:hypothetical protein J4218_05475 [Candidatus Pacearchaeota archaeon]|nr:hypothetical protein [Candidatus Pacearchaeota archaeon]